MRAFTEPPRELRSRRTSKVSALRIAGYVLGGLGVIGGGAGAVVGFLAGSSLFIIPGVGPVLFAGAMASGITGGLVGGLVGAMTGWGVKDAQIRDYEQQLRDGKSLVVITGDPAALAAAEEELRAAGAVQTTLHAETADSGRIDP